MLLPVLLLLSLLLLPIITIIIIPKYASIVVLSSEDESNFKDPAISQKFCFRFSREDQWKVEPFKNDFNVFPFVFFFQFRKK